MNIKDYPQGLLFDGKLQAEIKDRFWNVDSDPEVRGCFLKMQAVP